LHEEANRQGGRSHQGGQAAASGSCRRSACSLTPAYNGLSGHSGDKLPFSSKASGSFVKVRMMRTHDEEVLHQAAEAVALADALLIGAGAGMGVDSGLPDFRGDQGFWNAYPPYAKRGLHFTDLANPQWFHTDPMLAWGFYGHRLNLYRGTQPHAGFQILRR